MDDHRELRNLSLHRLNRRRFVTGLAATTSGSAVMALLAACGGSDEPESTTTSAAPTTTSGGGAGPTPASGSGAGSAAPTASGAGASASPAPSGAGTPVKGGTAIIVLDGDPPTVNMAITSGVTDGVAASKVQQGLTVVSKAFEYLPELAQKWDITADGLKYTFHLQPGVKFSDGQPMTSADVKFTMLEVLAKFHPISGSTFQRIATIDTPDEVTAVINLKEPYGPFINATEATRCAILPKHIFEGKDVLKDPHSLSEPIGTGPFVLKEWKRGDSLTFERNPNYWEAGKPYLDRVILKIIPQASTRTSALKAGEVDYIMDYMFDKADFQIVESDAQLQINREGSYPGQTILIINTRNKPFDDKRVRQALLTGMDRQFIIDSVMFGLGLVAKSSITPQFPWAYNPKVDLSKQFAFDTAKANKMLDDAGYTKGSGGKRFTARLVFDVGRPGYQQFGEIIRSNWDAVGIDVQLQPVERQVMIEKTFTNWDFDASIQVYASSGDPAIGVSRTYVTSSIGQRPFSNASGYSNPMVDDLFDKGATQPTNDKRAPFYFQVQEILAEDLPTLPLIDNLYVDVSTTKLQVKDTIWNQSTVYTGWEEVWRKP